MIYLYVSAGWCSESIYTIWDFEGKQAWFSCRNASWESKTLLCLSGWEIPESLQTGCRQRWIIVLHEFSVLISYSVFNSPWKDKIGCRLFLSCSFAESLLYFWLNSYLTVIISLHQFQVVAQLFCFLGALISPNADYLLIFVPFADYTCWHLNPWGFQYRILILSFSLNSPLTFFPWT